MVVVLLHSFLSVTFNSVIHLDLTFSVSDTLTSYTFGTDILQGQTEKEEAIYLLPLFYD